MQQVFHRVLFFFALAALCATSAAAGTVNVGDISWDVNFPGNAGQFDIVNLTGPNVAGPTFPITTELSLSNLTLVVDFVGGGTVTHLPGSGYFSLAPDGESYNGTAIPIGGTNPEPIDATLTGTFSPTSILDPGADSILSSFSVFFSDATNGNTNGFLVDGDLGVIQATEGTGGSSTPEPGTWMLLAMGFVGLMIMKGMKRRSMKTTCKTGTSMMLSGLLPVLFLVVAQSAFGQVSLTTWTSPSSGVAGAFNVNVTASYVPAGTIHAANIAATFATTCGGAAVKTQPANTIKTVIGSTDRVNVSVPAGLATGNYFVTIADSAGGDADFTTNAGSCSEVSVTASAGILNACVAGSSMGVLLPPGGAAGNVTAYVPKGYWTGSTTGVFAQNIEGSIGATTSIGTPHVANSCSSNPATGQTVCVANNTDVYLITGTTLNTTLTSGSNTTASFSGGTCNNCGVALNANNNTAVINMGVSGGTDGGVQILNLNTNTFSTPFPMAQYVSENISVDPTRSLILSAGEGQNFDLLQIQTGGSLKEFAATFLSGVEDDSSAEDCSTGVGIASGEFTNSVQLVNLNNISFGATTYTAPNALATLSTSLYSFSAGLSGSAVAQGSGHLAVVTGEFGGNTFGVLQLPASPGAGVPALVDYAIAQIPPSAACGGAFSAGFDPHTITAYTSPNNGDSYAVFAGYSGSVPICVALVDMTKVITLAVRGLSGYGAHEISPASLAAVSGAVTFFPL
jgi:hypothetical protein